MSWSDSYKTRIDYFGDYWENNGVASFEEYLNASPNKKTITVNEVSYVVTIQDGSALDNDIEDKIILSKISDEFNIGDIISWDNKTWLIYWKEIKTIKNCNRIKMQECNNILKYYKDYILYESPCIMSNSSISKGNIKANESKFITLAADEYIVTCSNNVDNSHIDENTRFILNRKAYQVVGIDDLTKSGLLYIKIKETVITANDNKSLGIADYYNNQITREAMIKNGTDATLFYANSTLQLNIEAKENGVIVVNPTLTYTSSNTYVCTVSASGLITAKGTGTATVTVTFGGVSDSMIIHSDMVVVDGYNLTLIPSENTILLNSAKTFTAHFWNNGVEVFNQNCRWIISNSDGTSIPYATISPNGINCILFAINKTSNVGKYVKLRSELISDSNVYIEHEIKIISLI